MNKELSKEERFLIDMFCIENYSNRPTITLQGCAKALKAYADQEKRALEKENKELK